MQSDSFRVLAQALEQPSGETTVTPTTIFLIQTNSLIRTLFIFLWSGTVWISEDPLYQHTHIHTHTYTHTHARAHTHAHTQTHNKMQVTIIKQTEQIDF